MTEQTNTQLTDEEALAELERRVAAMEAGPFRTSWEQIVSIEKNRQRIRAIERATKVTLPPDTSRWSGRPPPPSTPPAEPPSDRPSGWAKFDPLSSPPGLRWIDQQLDAADARDRMERIESERAYRQAVLDAHAEQKLIEQERRRKQAERTCHRGPGDPDFE
jgi:hypothetical protein